MFSVIAVLNKTIVLRFYERNAGFFLFVFLVMFGIVESSQVISYHLSLIGGMLSSGIFMTVVFGVWLAYGFKCLQFINEILSNPRNGFLFIMRSFKRRIQFEYFFFVVGLLFLPIIFYTFFIVGTAIVTSHWIELAIITVYLLSLISASTWIVVLKLKDTSSKLMFFNVPAVNILINKWISTFYLFHLLRNRSIPLLLTKLFSMLTIIGFFHIEVDHYEVRIALLGLLIGLSAHAVLIFEMRKFEDESLKFMRNMPLSILIRFSQLFIVYGILLLPELVLFGINHISFFDCLLVWVFGVSYLLFSHMSLYPIWMNMDRFIIRALLFFLIAFMLVLFKLFIITMIALIIVSFMIYKKWYFRFELPYS